MYLGPNNMQHVIQVWAPFSLSFVISYLLLFVVEPKTYKNLVRKKKKKGKKGIYLGPNNMQ